MSAAPLSVDVYVAPMRSYNCPDALGEGGGGDLGAVQFHSDLGPD